MPLLHEAVREKHGQSFAKTGDFHRKSMGCNELSTNLRVLTPDLTLNYLRREIGGVFMCVNV
jgi:hypothetical protein